MMDAKGKLAERVLHWATDELHYSKDGQQRPNVHHMQKLCIGNMIPVWNFLLTHIKTEEEVQKIRGNLLLNSRKNLTQQRAEEEARVKLAAQRDSMRAALAEAHANIAKLQLELATLKSDVESEENKQSSIVRSIREREVRNTMLESHDRSQAVTANIMREYQARLLQVISHLKNQQAHTYLNHSTAPNTVPATFLQKPHSTRDPTSIYSSADKPVLETNSTRLIREICEFIKDAYDRHMSTQEVDMLVKDKLKDIFGIHGVRATEVLETLTHLALTLVKSSETRKGNPKKANGALEDYKGKTGVAEQLFNLRAAHAERFFRAVALRNAYNVNPVAAPAPAHLPAHATQLRRMQSTLRGMRAALRVVNDRIAELQVDIENGLQSGVDERVTQARAQLGRMLRTRGDHARELMRLRAQNVDYMSKINQARQVMSDIVKTNISPTKTELSAARESFSINAKLEIETLTKMDISKSLPATLGRNKEVKEGGILAAIRSSSSSYDNGPESLLQKLFAAKVQLEEAAQHVDFERRLLEASMTGPVSVSINNSKTISNIVKRNEAFMDGQKQLAVRQQSLQREAEQAINKAATTRQGADIWWQQPAQYLVPWVTITLKEKEEEGGLQEDGRSLEEFIHEWRSLCSLLESKK